MFKTNKKKMRINKICYWDLAIFSTNNKVFKFLQTVVHSQNMNNIQYYAFASENNIAKNEKWT